ncbi:MAG: twin-arginine translocation signal domain-containing protein, partial [Verrucomicrobia bacterium]|nr:twin-arginine translocation signal domain-containing protein [Verrucomicrobiota bacterium]
MGSDPQPRLARAGFLPKKRAAGPGVNLPAQPSRREFLRTSGLAGATLALASQPRRPGAAAQPA